MDSTHKISIILPMYNAEAYIEKTILSVLNQTYQNWELIITDDCSKDNSINIVKPFLDSDKRIKLLISKENKGPAEARNNSLENSSGRFIAFLDSDDLWLPDKLEKQITFMLENSYYFTYTKFKRIKNEIKIGHSIIIPKEISYNFLLKNTAIATSTVILDTFNIKVPIKMKKVYYDDFTLWLEILKSGTKAYGLQEDLMLYRVLKNSISRNKINSAKWVWHIYRKQEKLNIVDSVWNFIHYVVNALLKYARF